MSPLIGEGNIISEQRSHQERSHINVLDHLVTDITVQIDLDRDVRDQISTCNCVEICPPPNWGTHITPTIRLAVWRIY